MCNDILFSVAYMCFVGVFLWISGCILPSFLVHIYVSAACVLLSAIIIYYSFPFAKRWHFSSRVPSHNKAVLITGCDTGFGNELAKRLDSKGFHVFASCLFPNGQGAKELETACSTRMHVLGLDVTDDKSIKDALDYVKDNLGNSELWAVVNNAGINSGFAVEWTKLESFEKCLNVNTLGPVRVTKAFLPLLRRSKGRVVTVASLSGRLAILNLAPYTMSKFAAVGFSQCLRLEMRQWGVKVISVEPECFKTEISNFEHLKKSLDDVTQTLDEDLMADYGMEYFKNMERKMKRVLDTYSDKRHIVVNDLEDAVSLQYPNDVYQPCKSVGTSVIAKVLQILPTSFLERIILFGYSLL